MDQKMRLTCLTSWVEEEFLLRHAYLVTESRIVAVQAFMVTREGV